MITDRQIKNLAKVACKVLGTAVATRHTSDGVEFTSPSKTVAIKEDVLRSANLEATISKALKS